MSNPVLSVTGPMSNSTTTGDPWVLNGNFWTWSEVQGVSDNLVMMNNQSFGLMPEGATVFSIIAFARGHATALTDVLENNVQLIVNGVPTGPNKANIAPWGTTDTQLPFWTWTAVEAANLGLTPDIINASNFGLCLSLKTNNHLGQALVDNKSFDIQITYVPSPTGCGCCNQSLLPYDAPETITFKIPDMELLPCLGCSTTPNMCSCWNETQTLVPYLLGATGATYIGPACTGCPPGGWAQQLGSGGNITLSINYTTLTSQQSISSDGGTTTTYQLPPTFNGTTITALSGQINIILNGAQAGEIESFSFNPLSNFTSQSQFNNNFANHPTISSGSYDATSKIITLNWTPNGGPQDPGTNTMFVTVTYYKGNPWTASLTALVQWVSGPDGWVWGATNTMVPKQTAFGPSNQLLLCNQCGPSQNSCSCQQHGNLVPCCGTISEDGKTCTSTIPDSVTLDSQGQHPTCQCSEGAYSCASFKFGSTQDIFTTDPNTMLPVKVISKTQTYTVTGPQAIGNLYGICAPQGSCLYIGTVSLPTTINGHAATQTYWNTLIVTGNTAILMAGGVQTMVCFDCSFAGGSSFDCGSFRCQCVNNFSDQVVVTPVRHT
jgi:hypothetical protein